MGVAANIVDGRNGRSVKVTDSGQLVVGPVECNSVSAKTLAVNGQGYTMIEPIPHKKPIIDGIIINSDKNVSATVGAAVEIYQSETPNSATVSKPIITIELLKLQTIPLLGLNICTDKGAWINAKTADNNINLSILYYYVD